MVTVTAGSGGNVFSPSSFTINPGDTVQWIWVAGHHNTSGFTVPAGAASWYANLTSTDTMFRFVPTVSGLYTYTCTHHSGMDGRFFVTGCSFPAKPLISGAASACPGDTVHLSTLAQPGVSYQWIRDNVALPLSNDPAFPATFPGTYRVLVNRCGVDSISDPFPVAIHALPVPSFTSSGTGLSYAFTNNTASPSNCTFLWTFSDGSPVQTTFHAVHTFASPGAYTVTLTATDTVTHCTNRVSQSMAASLGTALPGREEHLIFPNPASSGIYVPAGPDVSVYLSDLNGRRVTVPVIRQRTTFYLDLSRPDNGVYLLSVSDGSRIETRRVTVLH